MMDNKSSFKKLVNSKSGVRFVWANENHQSPFVVEEPMWTPDRETSNCTKCGIKFGFTIRKHHCRRCGLIFCKCCCHNKLLLPRMCFIDPVRVCLDCEPKIKLENTFFDKHLKILVCGANFVLGNTKDEVEAKETAFCKLSSDHRFLTFEGKKFEPVQLINISSLTVNKPSDSGGSRLTINYSNGGTINSVHLGTNSKENSSQILWIKALQQAYSLLLQSIEPKDEL